MKEKTSTNLLNEYKKLQTAKRHSGRTAIVLLFIIIVTTIYPKFTNTWLNLTIMIISLFLAVLVKTINIYSKRVFGELTNSLIDEGYIEIENKFVGEYDIKDKRKVENQYKIKIKQTLNVENFYLYVDEIKFTKHHNTYQTLINEVYKNYKTYHIYSYKIIEDNYYSNLLKYQLEDDESEVGGISFEGYTLKDYLEETGLIKDINQLLFEPNLVTLNKHLKESGIKPIKTQNK